VKEFLLGLGPWRVDYARKYGIDKRSGWSVFFDGAVAVQFEKHLLVALIKAARIVRGWE
jgi:hypothetical protein